MNYNDDINCNCDEEQWLDICDSCKEIELSIKKSKKSYMKLLKECTEEVYNFYTDSNNWSLSAKTLMPEFNNDKTITIKIINNKLRWLSERNLFNKKTFNEKLFIKLKNTYGTETKQLLYDIGLYVKRYEIETI